MFISFKIAVLYFKTTDSEPLERVVESCFSSTVCTRFTVYITFRNNSSKQIRSEREQVGIKMLLKMTTDESSWGSVSDWTRAVCHRVSVRMLKPDHCSAVWLELTNAALGLKAIHLSEAFL